MQYSDPRSICGLQLTRSRSFERGQQVLQLAEYTVLHVRSMSRHSSCPNGLAISSVPLVGETIMTAVPLQTCQEYS